MTLGHTKLILLASAAAFLLAAAPVRAADVSAPVVVMKDTHTWDIAFGVTLTSDYISRGVSGSYHGAAVQPWAELTINDCFYVGYWGSNVANASLSGWESDLSIGVRPKWGPVSFDFGYVRYLYSNQAIVADYSELYAKASISPVENLTVGVAGYIDPQTTANTYAEANAAYVIHDKFKISGAIGQVSGSSSYSTWNAGVAWTPMPWVTVDGRYHSGPDSNKFVISLSLSSSLKTLGVIH
ncbi:hypothetical protein BH10PSE9_BH10PSE9_02930 [soil metagenome]